MFGLTKEETAVFKKLTTPIKIQNFLNTIPVNFEKKGETLYSPRNVLRHNKAHCFEGALFAAAVLWFHGEKPLIIDIISSDDDESHVLALYKRNNLWGAISKTNHATIRFRDPVYKNVRELVMSYFHEYFLNTTGKKTLRTFPRPFNLATFGEDWVTSSKDLWDLNDLLDEREHFDIVPRGHERYLRHADHMEIAAGKITEWKASDSRT